MAPSLQSMCLVSRKHPSHHVTEAGGRALRMAQTRDKRREGVQVSTHDPAPRTQHGALCSGFCHLFSARKRHREPRARWARRQSCGCRADNVHGHGERGGTARSALRRQTNPCENCSLEGDKGRLPREPGPGAVPWSGQFHTALCPAL